MKITCTALWLPKHGNSLDEYEDAAAPTDPVAEECADFRCAVADGATETSFSRLWANLLVDGFVKDIDRETLRKKWRESVADKPLAWYAEEKAQSGAYAAFVSLNLKPEGKTEGSWQASALGDSCLIHLRGKELLEKFPLTKADEFNSSPVLISSNVEDGKDHGEALTTLAGKWHRGDIFYLMTDAIAHWVYKRQEDHGDAGFFLQAMNETRELEEFVELQRNLLDGECRPLMRNDDVTLMRVTVE